MTPSAIAIVGMAGRFPGARNVREFWQNLHDGKESIRDLSDAELIAAGATSADIGSATYVKRAAVLEDVDLFDAAFFGLSPKDAAIMDPQHRHFLECAWEALEDAAHPPQSFNGSIGVFAGSGLNSYLIHNLLANRELVEQAGLFQLKQTGNDKDVLTTRASYQFDLRGPSINVQTACSTSLVAVHLACQSLLNFECDMALAGGVTIEVPHGLGYYYREGEVLSRDGRCRSFDASSTGTVFGSGVGIVVVRRLEDALADRDSIRAVILGSAINNDGARKVGYLAPSVEGQAEVISEALEFAGVSAEQISYVEAHGTGTIVGDPIEVRALTQAFRRSTDRRSYCAIGSLKSNVGHLDAASGVAALMKTVLALEHAQLPASLHFQTPNPHIEFAGSPFYVNSKLSDWPAAEGRRRAGVTSLGIGGTNAHVVLEEAPARPLSQTSRPFHLLTVSAKTETAAESAASNLSAYLEEQPEVSLDDAAFTSQVGRHGFPYRRSWVVTEFRDGATDKLTRKQSAAATGVAAAVEPQVVFLFPGQGSQYVNMGRELYEHQPAYRAAMDICAEHLLVSLGVDLRRILYPAEAEQDAAAKQLSETWLAQPTLFATEYALAQWWMSLGVEPAAMVGHGIGECVAACLAGVFSLEDALAVTALRGRLMSGLPAGAMLAVQLPAEALYLTGSLSLAAVNGRNQCVVSGPVDEIRTLEQDLAMQSVACKRLVTSHPFHSAMMDTMLAEFELQLRGVALHPPRIPYLSNLSGTWIKDEEATAPAYWAGHLRNTVRFADCLAELHRNPERILIEVGPGDTLVSLARQQSGASVTAFHTLPHCHEASGGLASALHTVGAAWTRGVRIDWEKLHAPGSAHRIPLPTYPFEHKRFWIEPDSARDVARPVPDAAAGSTDHLSYYKRVWKAVPLRHAVVETRGAWLIFMDALGLGDEIAAQLKLQGHDVARVYAGLSYARTDEMSYTIRPNLRADYGLLMADIGKGKTFARKVINLWPLAPGGGDDPYDDTLGRCYGSPLLLAQALAEEGLEGVDIALVSSNLQQVSDEKVSDSERAVLFGPARVIPLELPGISCRSIDVERDKSAMRRCAEMILKDMNASSDNAAVAFRGGERFVESVEPFRLAGLRDEGRLEQGGVFLITGGTGGIGLTVAEHLAREFHARIVLVSRSAFGPESAWRAAAQDTRLSDAEREKYQKLIEIRSLAGGLLVLQGDVTDMEQMKNIVVRATERFGQIDGVFHAAGVLDDAPLMLKTVEGSRRVLDAKVRGTLVLDKLFENAPLRCFVLFSSVSSVFPAAGQVDYAAGNAFLDAFALSRGDRVTLINWGAWRGVGMAARAGASHPLLHERLLNTPREIVYGSKLSAQSDWVLAEHKLKTTEGLKPLLPGTAYMEMATAALPRGLNLGPIELRDVFFLAPLLMDENESRELRVQLRREKAGEAKCDGFQFAVFSQRDEWIEHCNGTISSRTMESGPKVDLNAILNRCAERTIAFGEEHRVGQERLLKFGPRWHSLRRLRIGMYEGLAEVELDEELAADVSEFRMHPALLDLATGVSLYLTNDYEEAGDLFLPISYKRMRLYHSLPAKFFSHLRPLRHVLERAAVETFDITLIDTQGEVLAQIEGFTMRRIENPGALLHAKPASLAVGGAGSEQPIEVADRPGIDPADGVQALMRILSLRVPHGVIAVANPLPEASESSSVVSPHRTGAKSGLSGETVESAIAAWWQQMLGVEEVGPDDDFFDLGGHSLVGARFLAAVRKEYGVDLDLSVLFDVGTPSGIAGVIRNSMTNAADIK